MITNAQLHDLTGEVVSQDSEPIGAIGHVYLDETTGDPSWVGAKTGPSASTEILVSLVNAQPAGDDVRVAFSKEKVAAAPLIDTSTSPSSKDLGRLNRYYGLPDDTPADAVTEAADPTRDTMTSTGYITSADMRPTRDR